MVTLSMPGSSFTNWDDYKGIQIVRCSFVLPCMQESREAAEEKEEGRRALLREHRKVERELVKQGKKPFFIKKCMQQMYKVCSVVKP